MGKPSELHKDHIAKAYLGSWGDEFTQQKSRKRIDWLVDEAVGSRVLDIGCSEGILPILLGRKGYEVIGIDIHPEALDYAQSLLEEEESEVKSRVTFKCGDLFELDLEGKRFDTVILGQVLEHFSQPQNVIDRSIQFIKKDGTILVTTPYGYLPHEDHRFTFSIGSFLELFQKDFNPRSLDIVDGNIHFVGINRNPTKKAWKELSRDRIADLIEQTVLEEQSRLYGHIDRLRNSFDDANLKYRDLGEAFAEQKNRLSDLKEALNSTREERKQIKNSLEEANQKYRSLGEDYKTTKIQIDNLHQMLHDLNEEKLQIDRAYKESQEAFSKMKQEQESLQQKVEEGNRRFSTLEIKHRNIKLDHNNILDYYEDFQQSTVYRSVIAIRRALYNPGRHTLLLPFTLIDLAIRKFKKDRRTRKSAQAVATSMRGVGPFVDTWKRIE